MEVWVDRRCHVPRIPSGMMAEFCHRMFHRPLGLVGIQSSQSFFIWGSQLLSINCTPNRGIGLKALSSVVLGKKKLLPFSEKEKLKDPTSYQQHTPLMGYYSQSRLPHDSAEEWKMTSHAALRAKHFSSVYRCIGAAMRPVSSFLDREQSG